MTVEEYQKPTVTTMEIPERTSYACNLGDASCPTFSNVVGHGICPDSFGIAGLGTCA